MNYRSGFCVLNNLSTLIFNFILTSSFSEAGVEVIEVGIDKQVGNAILTDLKSFKQNT